jgi:hypothetical protein
VRYRVTDCNLGFVLESQCRSYKTVDVFAVIRESVIRVLDF